MKKMLILGLIIILFSSCRPLQNEPTVEWEDTISTLVAATQTAETQPKEQPGQTISASVVTATPDPAEQATETPAIIPTQTPSPTSTETPTITPTGTIANTPTLAPEDPILSLGAPSVKDTFDSGSILYQYDETQSSFQVVDNQFVLIAKKSNGYETWSLSWEEFTNFYLEITGSFGDECSGKDRYGMIFRAPDTSEGYLISISCDGSFRLSKWESETEEYTVLTGWTTSEYIAQGPGGLNRLGVMVKGSKITGYVNGHQVFEVNDGTFTSGRFGVLVAASNTAGFTASLDQAVYWKLP